MTDPARIEIDLETLVVEGMTAAEAAALVDAAERALNARLAGGATVAIDALPAMLVAAIRDGSRRAG